MQVELDARRSDGTAIAEPPAGDPFNLKGAGVGAGIGLGVGLAGGPLAPISVPVGILVGAGAGALVEQFTKLTGNQVPKSVQTRIAAMKAAGASDAEIRTYLYTLVTG